jgi:NTP pyrophosphatase (non-canonical NTP hydrolase)
MLDIQDKIKEYLKARKWDKNEPADLSKSIVIESAELLELFQWSNTKRKDVLKDDILLAKLKGEVADICIYAIGMAISLGLDIEKVISEKLIAVEKKYPVNKIKKGQEEYLRIKHEHRRKNA